MVDDPEAMAEYAQRSGIVEPPEKPWWQSRTIIGTLVSSAAIIAGVIGFELDADQVTELAVAGAALAGNILAWYGRVKASKVINTRKVLPGVTLGK